MANECVHLVMPLQLLICHLTLGLPFALAMCSITLSAALGKYNSYFLLLATYTAAS